RPGSGRLEIAGVDNRCAGVPWLVRGTSGIAVDDPHVGRHRAVRLFGQQVVVARAAHQGCPCRKDLTEPAECLLIVMRHRQGANPGQLALRLPCYQPPTPSGITKRVMAKARVVTLTAGASA